MKEIIFEALKGLWISDRANVLDTMEREITKLKNMVQISAGTQPGNTINQQDLHGKQRSCVRMGQETMSNCENKEEEGSSQVLKETVVAVETLDVESGVKEQSLETNVDKNGFIETPIEQSKQSSESPEIDISNVNPLKEKHRISITVNDMSENLAVPVTDTWLLRNEPLDRSQYENMQTAFEEQVLISGGKAARGKQWILAFQKVIL